MVPKGTGDNSRTQPPDVEDVCITTNTANAVSIHQVQHDPQLARKKLAAKKKDVDMVIIKPICSFNGLTFPCIHFNFCMLMTDWL